MSRDLASRQLRTSSAFALVGLDELQPAVREALGAAADDRQFYGILKPRDPRLPAKSVSKEAALLLLTLRRPQRVPALLASIFGPDVGPLHALLADGVLEVEHDGHFVSGPDALRLIGVGESSPQRWRTPGLAEAAIECAASYEGLDAGALAEKVYAFGRQPCTPSLRRHFERDAALFSFLTSDEGLADLLWATWASEADGDAGGEGPWLSFSTQSATPRLSYKLYVSARLEVMPRVFAMAVRALKRTRCAHFKIGRRAEGLCRPDKMVAYFSTLDELHECAALIEADLLAGQVSSASAHGVPFAASIDAAGFLSWGMDPPELAGTATALDPQSWRGWIASRVAVAVLNAPAGSVVPFVLQRLELDGIDSITWAPNLALWRGQGARAGDVA
jgi:hypothetical protein